MCGELRLESRGLYNPIGVYHPHFNDGVRACSTLDHALTHGVTTNSGKVLPGRSLVLAVRAPNLEHGCLLKHMRWGIAMKNNRLLYNARSETILDKPTFSKPMLSIGAGGRGIIVVRAFREGPGWFGLKDNKPFGLACVHNHTGFAVITCEANRVVEPYKSRMPCILPARKWDGWLNEKLSPNKDNSLFTSSYLKPLNHKYMEQVA